MRACLAVWGKKEKDPRQVKAGTFIFRNAIRCGGGKGLGISSGTLKEVRCVGKSLCVCVSLSLLVWRVVTWALSKASSGRGVW